MIRKLLFVVVSLCTMTLFAQEEIGRFQNSLKTSSSNIKDVFPIVDQKTGELAIFISDAKNVYAYKLSENFEVLQKLSSQEKLRKYKFLIGSSVSANGDYLVYLSNKSQRKFLCVSFSFDTQTTNLKEFTFQNKEERLLQTIHDNNQFYILSYYNPPNNNAYNDTYAYDDFKGVTYIYTFDEAGNVKRTQLDVNKLRFRSKKDQKVSFNWMLTDFSGAADLQKFIENDPHSIESVAVPRKMYIRDEKVIFSFDQNRSFTQMVLLDLNTLALEFKTYEKPLPNISNAKKRSNSYLNGDYLFLSTTTKNEHELQILKYKTMDVVKTYRIEKDKPIDFKNTPIIQEGGFYDNYRELEKTKKFLRKIYQGNMGLSVLHRNNQYEVTLGGFVQQNSGGGLIMPGFGIPIASAGGVTLFFDATAMAYDSYTSTKSTRIECLLDEDMNHLQGEIPENAFDKMNADETFSPPATESVFRYRDFYIRGSYDKKNRTYRLQKFSN